MILLPIIWFLVVLAGFLYVHVNRWKKNTGIKHKKTAWIRMALLLPSTIMFTVFHPMKIWWLIFIIAAIMQGCVFLFLFNGLYNRFRKFDWWFKGSIDKDQSWWDNIFMTMRDEVVRALQITGCVLFTSLYIVLWLV